MITRLFGDRPILKNTLNIKRSITVVAGLLAVSALCVSTQADAQVRFRYIGGRWGHAYRSGWHRYWGGPSIGFYYAPAPVYVVPGYAAASYYTGPNFWYSNPSFGLSLNLGGGGYYHGGYSHGGYYRGGGYSHGGGYYHGDRGHDWHGGGHDWHRR